MKWVAALSKQAYIETAVQDATKQIIGKLEGEEAYLTIIFIFCTYS